MSKRQFRYARANFRTSVAVAAGLTTIITFLVWVFSRLMGLAYANTLTVTTGTVFFAFCSAAMIWRYMRNEIIVAIRPDGLFDARRSNQAVPWDEIKDVRLARQENEFHLEVFLWPGSGHATGGNPAFTIDLAPLDGGVEAVLEALSQHVRIFVEAD